MNPLLTLDLSAPENLHIYRLLCNARQSNQYQHASSNRLVIHHLNESMEQPFFTYGSFWHFLQLADSHHQMQTTLQSVFLILTLTVL